MCVLEYVCTTCACRGSQKSEESLRSSGTGVTDSPINCDRNISQNCRSKHIHRHTYTHHTSHTQPHL